MIMRKVLFGALMGATLSASAGVKDILTANPTMSLTDAVKQASADCGGTCIGEIAADLQALGKKASDVIAAAAASGLDVGALVAAAANAAMEKAITNGGNAADALQGLMSSLMAIPEVASSSKAQAAAVAAVTVAAVSNNVAVSSVMTAATNAGISATTAVAGVVQSNSVSTSDIRSAAKTAGIPANTVSAGEAQAAVNTGSTGFGGNTNTGTTTSPGANQGSTDTPVTVVEGSPNQV